MLTTDRRPGPASVLAISGSLRRGSINSAALRAAALAAARDGAAVIIDESIPCLPHFDPDLEPEPPSAVRRFRSVCERAQAVLLCVPEYAFGIPGAFKNALDWTVGSGSLNGKSITLLSVAPAGRGRHVREALDLVLGALGADVVHRSVPVGAGHRDADGEITDPEIVRHLRTVVADLTAPGRRAPQRMSDATLRVVPRGPARDDYLPLFRLADDAEAQVRAYYQDGDLYALEEPTGNALGLILVVPGGPGEVELKSVAVAPNRQGRGVGTLMLQLVLAELRARSVMRAVVGTASSSVGVLAFYQRAGFRLRSIERDYFTPERGYPAGSEEDGIPLRDVVWMDREP